MAVDDSYTKALLHFEGADESTTIVDESGKTWTANNGAKIDSAHAKFGSTAGYVDGVNDTITTPDTADLQLGLTFTIDFQFWASAKPTTTYRGIIDKYSGNTAGYCIYVNNSGYIVCIVAIPNVTKTVDVCDSNWHHVAMVGDGTTLKLYIDGSGSAGATITGYDNNNSGHNVFIGGDGVSTFVTNSAFWIDELRFSKGIARWTSDFTPPSAPYSAGPPKIKTINSIAIANAKTVNGVAIGSVKSIQGIT